MLGKDMILKLGAPPVAGLILLGAVFYFLENFTAYRSPLYGAERSWTPRNDALADLTAWAARKAEEERKRAELLASLDTKKMVELGKEIVYGRGLCFNCHKVGPDGRGTQGPNLDGVGARAGSRVEGKNDIEYLAQSLYQPDAFIVPGYVPAMTRADQPPIGLKDLDILMVIAYLQSLGGEPTVAPDTRLPYGSGN